MSAWTHAQCERCWFDRNSEINEEGEMVSVRLPVRMTQPPEEALRPCCFCRQPTIACIYVRHDAKELVRADGVPCHVEEEDE